VEEALLSYTLGKQNPNLHPLIFSGPVVSSAALLNKLLSGGKRKGEKGLSVSFGEEMF